jgi:hypothetical protein
LTLDEYLVELAVQGLDPPERAREYVEAARELLEEARRELGEGNVRQAAGKAWGATALAVKAYAEWKEGRRLASYKELWEYKDAIADDIGGWFRAAFREASALHTCFYEGWCTGRDVQETLSHIEKLVNEIWRKIMGGQDQAL